MLSRILLGLFIAAVGFLMTWQTDFFMGFGGSIDWAERNLGAGGTRLFYKLLGIAIILVGFLVITNLFNEFVTSLVGSIFG